MVFELTEEGKKLPEDLKSELWYLSTMLIYESSNAMDNIRARQVLNKYWVIPKDFQFDKKYQ